MNCYLKFPQWLGFVFDNANSRLQELKAKVEQTQAEYDQTCKKIETILTSKSKKKKDALFQEQQIQKV